MPVNFNQDEFGLYGTIIRIVFKRREKRYAQNDSKKGMVNGLSPMTIPYSGLFGVV